MTYRKLSKKLKKFIKKHWKVKVDVNLDDTIISLAEEIVMKSENCSLQEAYDKWIIKPNLHLPGWVSIYIVDEFCEVDKVTQNDTIRALFDKAIG